MPEKETKILRLPGAKMQMLIQQQRLSYLQDLRETNILTHAWIFGILSRWYAILQTYNMIIPIYNVCFLYFFNFDNFTILQNDGEIEYFTVNVLDNDNGKAKNVWSLPSPNIQDKGLWRQGRVQISSDGDKEYQVR